MSDLTRYHRGLGARLAPDDIPLDYGNLSAEHEALDGAAVLLDRSHEGRILLSGADRLKLVNRMSTNDLGALVVNEGRGTVFTNANARIMFRAESFHRPEGLLMISEPGQGQALAGFLQRNIFFGDKARVNDMGAATAQLAIHGPRADEIAIALDSNLAELPVMGSNEINFAGNAIILARRKSLSGGHWSLICPAVAVVEVYEQLLQLGQPFGLRPAGSLLYNILRIRSGRPGGRELSSDYIPLEIGLWDEISFSKGCYTGQEIIARMESRQRVAKALVSVSLSRMVSAPAQLRYAQRAVGTLTSSVEAPNGLRYALAVVKVDCCKPGTMLKFEKESAQARVIAFAGVHPPFINSIASGP